MTKISNQRAYIPDYEINGLDYLPGTDFDQGLKTVNFRVQDLGTHYNTVNGLRNFDYNFYQHQLQTATPQDGFFYSNNNEQNPSNITYLIFSKKTSSGKNIFQFFDSIANDNPFDLVISQKFGINTIFFFKIVSIETFGSYYKLNVSEAFFPENNIIEYAGSHVLFSLKAEGTNIHNSLNGLNEGDFIHLTQAEKNKLDNLPSIFPEVPTKTSDLINDGSDSTSNYVELDELSPVATSNNYNDLDNLPTIPTVITNHSELNLDDGTNPHGTTKNDVGLSNVDNTSDLNKPISTATQTALNNKQDNLNAINLGQIIYDELAIKSTPSPDDEIVMYDSITGEAVTAKFSDFGNDIAPLTLIREKFTFTSSQSFTLSQIPQSIVYVTVQGQNLDTTQFTISGVNLTIIDTLDSGDIINILYGFQYTGFVPTLEQVLAQGTSLEPTFSNDTGWAQYTDTLRTVSTPLVINSGNTATLTCNGGTTIKTQMPLGFIDLFDVITNKLQAIRVDDDFILNVRFKAKTSVVNDFLSIGINIGAGPTVSAKDEVFTRGANTPQQFSIVLPYFTRSTFIANGGLIQITARNGNIQIYDISIKPTLIHKAF